MNLFTLTHSGTMSLAGKSQAYQVLWSSECKAYQHHTCPCSCLPPKKQKILVLCLLHILPMKIRWIIKSKIHTSTNSLKMWRTFMSVCPTCVSRSWLPYFSNMSAFGKMAVMFEKYGNQLHKHVSIWQDGCLSIHIRLELNLNLAGICNNREQWILRHVEISF